MISKREEVMEVIENIPCVRSGIKTNIKSLLYPNEMDALADALLERFCISSYHDFKTLNAQNEDVDSDVCMNGDCDRRAREEGK